MPDINPAELSSRPAAINMATPLLPSRTIAVSALKTKTSQIIPPRIELESAYLSLKLAIGPEQWTKYRNKTTQFLIGETRAEFADLAGRLNQAEYSAEVDPILLSPSGEKEHLHNRLISAIYANVTREMPDQGLAPWVSANEKPSQGKPTSGDANERRLKGEIMQLPNKDRRRIKDLVQNRPFDPYDALSGVFAEQHRSRTSRSGGDIAPSSAVAGGIDKMNLDVEIRKRFVHPLAVESGEFPDTSNVEARMMPFCYEAGLTSGHAADAAQFVALATETFIKEVLSAVFSRTRSNGPGEAGSAGFGGNNWVQTHRYRRQLVREEDRAQQGFLQRDKMGLLPVEAKAASRRGALGLAEFRLALEMGDCGLTQFPAIGQSLMYAYREGELESWNDYTWVDSSDNAPPLPQLMSASSSQQQTAAPPDAAANAATAPATATTTQPLPHPPAPAINGVASAATAGATPGAGPKADDTSSGNDGAATTSDAAVPPPASTGASAREDTLPDGPVKNGLFIADMPNGILPVEEGYPEAMDLDSEEVWWEGAEAQDGDMLNNVLDSCLAVG